MFKQVGILLIVFLWSVCVTRVDLQVLNVSDIKTDAPYGFMRDSAEYGELMKNISCSFPHKHIEEIQLALLYGDIQSEQFVIFALATRNQERTDFIIEHVMDQWVESAMREIKGDRLVLTINVWAMFKKLKFVCHVVPTAYVDWVKKSFELPYYVNYALWAWANTSSITRDFGAYEVHMSCDGPRSQTLKFERLMSRVMDGNKVKNKIFKLYTEYTPLPANRFNGMFPMTHMMTYTSTHPDHTLNFEYQPDGRKQFDIVERATLTAFEKSSRSYRQTCSSRDGRVSDNTSWELIIPIVEKPTTMQPYVVGDTSHVWRGNRFTLTCTVSGDIRQLNSITLTASKLYTGNIIKTRRFDVIEEKMSGIDATIVSTNVEVVITLRLEHKFDSRTVFRVVFTCAAGTTDGQLSGETTVIYMLWPKPQHIVKPMLNVYPSLSGKAHIIGPFNITTGKLAVMKCDLDGHGDYTVVWQMWNTNLSRFGNYPFYDHKQVSEGNQQIQFHRPELSDSGTYRCLVTTVATPAVRVSRAVNVTVSPAPPSSSDTIGVTLTLLMVAVVTSGLFVM